MGSKKEKKVFISHSSADMKQVRDFVNWLVKIGLTKDQIICTSDPDCCSPLVDDIRQWLNTQFQKYELYVLIMMSDSYLSSSACQWELGKADDAPNRQVILLPGFDMNKQTFGINPYKIYIELGGDKDLLKTRLSQLKTSLYQFFSAENTVVLKAAETIFAKMRSLAGKDSKAYEEFKALFKDTSEEEIALRFHKKYPAAAHYVKQVCTLVFANEDYYYVELDFYTVGKSKSGKLEILQRETSFLPLYYEDGQWWIKKSPADRLPDECFPDGFAEAGHAGRKTRFYSPINFMYRSEKSVYEGIVHAEVFCVWENAGNIIECALWLANGLKQNVYFKEIEVVIRNEKKEEILHVVLNDLDYPVLVAGYSTVITFKVPDKILAKNGRRRWNKCEQVKQETRIIDYEIL